MHSLESQKQTCDATALRLREELAESEGEREAAGSQRDQAREQLSSTTEQCALLQDQLQKKETQLEHARYMYVLTGHALMMLHFFSGQRRVF